MAINLAGFEEQLRARAKLWSDYATESGSSIGLRAVKIDGDLVREAIIQQDNNWLDSMFAALPDDAVLMDIGAPSLILHDFCMPAGSYRDRYCLIFGSKTWPVYQEGDTIPELEIKLHRKAA
jgi:hypothetical protein